MKIESRVFLVAGGGSGLGAATATMLVAAGGKVVIADASDAGEAVARRLGPNAKFLKTDVTDETATQAAGELCVAGFGGVYGPVQFCRGGPPQAVGRQGR